MEKIALALIEHAEKIIIAIGVIVIAYFNYKRHAVAVEQLAETKTANKIAQRTAERNFNQKEG